MIAYSYKAIDQEGAFAKGVVEAEDLSAAYEGLSLKGFSVLSVKRANPLFARLGRRLQSRGVKRREVIELARNLSVMMRGGLPLLNSLDDIMMTTENKYLKKALGDMKAQVASGVSFSSAVEEHRDIFPDILIRLAGIGEETGTLEKSLSNAAEHLQKMEDLSQAIKRALIYPVLALVVTLGALIFWLVYVLPQIISVIKDMGVELPFITRMLIYLSELTQAYWYILILLPPAIFLVIRLLKRKESTRYYLDALKLKLPVVKLVVYNKLLALFSEQSRILIVAGITVDRSLAIIADVIGNEVFKRAILAAKDSISFGSGISEALKEQRVFPLLVVRMVGIGESSGSLDEQFAFLSNYYVAKLDDISEKMGKLMEPLVILVVGVMFIFVILGLMLPIYELVSKFGKM
jgi:type II secretory pathway component PulF